MMYKDFVIFTCTVIFRKVGNDVQILSSSGQMDCQGIFLTVAVCNMMALNMKKVC